MPPAARALRFRLGAFILIALMLLGGLVLMFGSAPGFLRSTTKYTVRFAEAPGVSPGTPVRRSGVRIGEVRTVTLDDETGIVRAEIGIDAGHTIRRNETPTLVTSLLGTDATIDFIPDLPPKDPKAEVDRSPWPPGSEIPGVRQVTVNALLKGASDVVPKTEETLNDIRNVMKSYERLQPEVQRALVEYRLLAEELRKAAPAVTKIATDAQKLSPAAEEALKEIRDTAKEMRPAVKEVGELAKELRPVVRDFGKITPDVQRFAKAAADAMPVADEAMKEIRDLAKELRPVVREAAKIIPDVQRFAKEAADAMPEIRRTNVEVQRFAKAAADAMPDFRKAGVEIAGLAKEVREAVPELRKTNLEVQALARDIRAEIPGIRRNLDDIGDAARQVRRTTERIDLLLIKNEPNITRTFDNFNRLLENGSDAARRINDLLSDENRKNIATTLKNVRAGTDRLDAISASLDDILNQGRTTVRQLNTTLKEAEEFLKDVRGTTGPLRERGPSILRNLDESLGKANATLTDLQLLIKAIGESDGTLTRLLKDPSLYNNLDCAAAQFAREMQRVDRILKDFETFADKLARHPELIGVGGAIRGSTGLKDRDTPPSQPPVIVPPQH